MYLKKLSSLFFTFLCILSSCTSQTEQGNSSYLNQFLAESKKASIIKFYAPWCSTCKSYALEFDKVKSELGSEIDFFEIDVDNKEYKELIELFKISRIPDTIFISKDRMQINRAAGPLSYEDLLIKAQDLLKEDESK
jgi:thiol-disulfide isomerase/thioredoxin